MPRAGRHALGEAGVQHAAVLLGVLVLEFAREHPRDDLHVAVRVGVEARAAADDVVVVDEQQAVPGVRGS